MISPQQCVPFQGVTRNEKRRPPNPRFNLELVGTEHIVTGKSFLQFDFLAVGKIGGDFIASFIFRMSGMAGHMIPPNIQS